MSNPALQADNDVDCAGGGGEEGDFGDAAVHPVASAFEGSNNDERLEVSEDCGEPVAENNDSTSTNLPIQSELTEDGEGFGRMQVCPEMSNPALQADNDVDCAGGGGEEGDFGDAAVHPVASAFEGSNNDERLEVSEDCGEPVAENNDSTSTNLPIQSELTEDGEGFGRMQVCPEMSNPALQADNDVDCAGGGGEEGDFGDAAVHPVASAFEGSNNDERLEVSEDCGEPVAENNDSTSTNLPIQSELTEDGEGFGRMQVCPEMSNPALQADNDVDCAGGGGEEGDFGDAAVHPVASAFEGSNNDERLEVSEDCGEPVAENNDSTSTNLPIQSELTEDGEGFGRMQVCPEMSNPALQADNDVDCAGGGGEEGDFGDAAVHPVASAFEGSNNDERLEVSEDCGEPVKGDQNAPDQSGNEEEVDVLDRQTLDNIAIVTLVEIPKETGSVKDDGSNKDTEQDDVLATDGSHPPEGSTSGEQKEVPDHTGEPVAESEKSSVANAEAEVTPNQQPSVNEDSLCEGEGRKENEEILSTAEPEGTKDKLHPEVLGFDQTDQSQVS
ncbi:hypothetical protein AAHC03_022540 [Spirometra sp. Aus1]